MDLKEAKNLLQAQSEIDYCYYSLNKLMSEITIDISPIKSMIDNVCDYKNSKEKIKEAIELVECIIKNKRKINIDVISDLGFLQELDILQNKQ